MLSPQNGQIYTSQPVQQKQLQQSLFKFLVLIVLLHFLQVTFSILIVTNRIYLLIEFQIFFLFP